MTKTQSSLLSQAAKSATGTVSATICFRRTTTHGERSMNAARALEAAGFLRFVHSSRIEEGRGSSKKTYHTVSYAITDAGRDAF